MNRIWVVVLSFCLLLASGSVFAFDDCSSPGYFSDVDARMEGLAADCHEVENFTIDTPKGPREVRIVHTSDLPTLDLPVMIAEIRGGVERSAAVLPSVGVLAPEDITIWISHLLHEEESDGDWDPLGPLGEMADVDDGCLLAVFPANTGRRELAFTIAHEFFHCVQGAEFPDAVALSATAWWEEGTAEWFANLALPGTGGSDTFVDGFDAVSSDTALTSMLYESVVFFFWLSEAHGNGAIDRLMRAMPATGGERGQQEALRTVLSAEDWQQFAQSYMEGNLHQPGGRAIASTPFPGDIYAWEASHTHTLSAAPFVLARAQLEFSCGVWSVSEDEAEGTRAFRRESGPWQDLPERIVSEDGAVVRVQMAGFGSTEAGFAAAIEATRDNCQTCPQSAETARAIDQCLVGRWELVSGGYGQQLEDLLRGQEGFESIDYPDLHRYLTLDPNGRYSQTPSEDGEDGEDGEADIRTEGGDLWRGLVGLQYETEGHWSADGNVLHLCEEQVDIDIDLTLIDPGDVESRTQYSGSPPDLGALPRQRTFECSEGALFLTESQPLMPGVNWEYRRAP